MAILFPGEEYPPIKPDLENIESFDNSSVGSIEKFGVVGSSAISIEDVVAKSGDTMTGTLVFDNNAAQGNSILDAIAVADENMRFSGTGKPWEDLRIEPTVRGTGANNPSFEQYFTDGAGSRGVYLYSFDDAAAGSEKEIYFTMQMPHAWDGGSIMMHVHWVGSTSDTTAAPRWGLEYNWKEIGATFGNTVIVYSDGSNYTAGGTDANVTAGIHYVSKFAALAPGTTADGLSSILIGRLFRNSSDGGDTYNAAGNKCGLLYVDAHYQISTIGSDDEYTK